jgi:hypothetical protein
MENMRIRTGKTKMTLTPMAPQAETTQASRSGDMPQKQQTSQTPSGWWTTLPGVLTGVAAIIVAITGLVTVFVQQKEAPAPASLSQKTPPSQALPTKAETAPATDTPAANADRSQSVKTGDIGGGASVNIQQKQ